MEITEIDRAVLSLKAQRRRLEDHKTRVETQVAREKEVARQLIASGHKDRAILALKKKRLQETTLTTLDAWLLNVESMLADVELSKDQVRVYAAIKQGNEAQKLLQKAVALEDVEKLMEETADAREYQEQLKAALGESLTAVDEAATEAELAALEGEVAREVAAELPSVPTAAAVVPEPQDKEEQVLPSVPTHDVVVPTTATTVPNTTNEKQPLPAS